MPDFGPVRSEPLPTNPFDWPTATAVTRPWTRWWWLGSVVDQAGIWAQLTAYAAAGMGGVEIQAVYGVVGRDSRAKRFLSPDWVRALDDTTRIAAELGLGVDLTTGSGWPFGGPWVADSDGAAMLLVEQWSSARGSAWPLGYGRGAHRPG